MTNLHSRPNGTGLDQNGSAIEADSVRQESGALRVHFLDGAQEELAMRLGVEQCANIDGYGFCRGSGSSGHCRAAQFRPER